MTTWYITADKGYIYTAKQNTHSLLSKQVVLQRISLKNNPSRMNFIPFHSLNCYFYFHSIATHEFALWGPLLCDHFIVIFSTSRILAEMKSWNGNGRPLSKSVCHPTDFQCLSPPDKPTKKCSNWGWYRIWYGIAHKREITLTKGRSVSLTPSQASKRSSEVTKWWPVSLVGGMTSGRSSWKSAKKLHGYERGRHHKRDNTPKKRPVSLTPLKASKRSSKVTERPVSLVGGMISEKSWSQKTSKELVRQFSYLSMLTFPFISFVSVCRLVINSAFSCSCLHVHFYLNDPGHTSFLSILFINRCLDWSITRWSVGNYSQEDQNGAEPCENSPCDTWSTFWQSWRGKKRGEHGEVAEETVVLVMQQMFWS